MSSAIGKTLCFAWLAWVAFGQTQGRVATACSDKCKQQKLVDESICVNQCTTCANDNLREADKNKCLNDYLKRQNAQEVKQGRDKAEQAKSACDQKRDAQERRTCYQTAAETLTRPTTSMTDAQRKIANANLKEFQRVMEEDEMMKRADDMKQNLIRANLNDADLEMEKRRMCGLCVNGTENKERMEDLSDAGKRQAQKVCIDKCVKQTLKDVEASELASCVNTSATRAENQRCFCKASTDDAQRMRLSDPKDADKTKGATEYMCGIYARCAEEDGVDCKDTMNELLMSAKDACNTGRNQMQQQLRITLPQLQQKCQQKQVSDSMEQCKNALTGGTPAEVRACIAETTRLTPGKVKKLERQELKKQVRDEYLTCKRCNRTASSDCPEMSDCKDITKNFMMAQLNSSCAGNYMALVEDGLALAETEADDQDEVVEVAKKACEVIIRFRRGRGACRAVGRMRRALELKLGRKGAEVDGVIGLAKGRNSTQIERGDVQEAKMIYTVFTTGSSGAEPEPETSMMVDDDAVEAKCANLVSKLVEAYGSRRLADLDADEDVDEVDSTQATDSCLASDTSCQEADLETDDEMGDDETTTSAAATGAGTTMQGSTSVAPATVANGTVPDQEHTVALTVTLTNISEVTDEATLIQQITDGLLAAAGGASASVTEVVIEFINVVSVYSNLPQIVVDAIIEAYVAMTSVARSSVTVNGEAHSQDGGRRLQSDAIVKAKVTKMTGVDIVQASQALSQSVSLSVMLTQLAATSSYDTTSLSTVAMAAITTELSVTTKVRGTATAPAIADIATQIGNSITSGGATVVVTSVTSNDVATTTAASVADNHAPVASLVILWAAVCYAFVMG